MRKRNLLRFIPGLARVAKALDGAERHNAQLIGEVQRLNGYLHQLNFVEPESLAETAPGENLPVPAGVLRYLVAGTDDLAWFLGAGQLGRKTLDDLLAKRGRSLAGCPKILDFGCGCGRVTRHLKGLTGVAVHGCDSNARAIRWCERNLDFADFLVNGLEPPLPYADGSFDLIYAFSVFKHLNDALQGRWMDELRRALAPGGLLVVTVHGDKCAEGLNLGERADYDAGRLVVREGDVVGSNFCSAFHPQSYVRGAFTRGFDVLEFEAEGAKGNPPQDAYLLQSRQK